MASLRELLNPASPTLNIPIPPQIEHALPALPSSPSTSNSQPSGRKDAAANLKEASPIKDHQTHDNCPDSLDCLPDTEGRPQHTLPVILRCAILGSARKRLTIRDIYAAMERKYPYYKTAGPAWKQSVRHHLSLNRLFERQAKPVAEPGFGSYWTVNLDAPPGTKRPRKRGRQTKTAEPEDAPQAQTKAPSKRVSPYTHNLDDPEIDLPSISTLPMPDRYTPPQQYGIQRQATVGTDVASGEPSGSKQVDKDASMADVASTGVSDGAPESDEDANMQGVQGEWSNTNDRQTFPESPKQRVDASKMLSNHLVSPESAELLLKRLQDEIHDLRRQTTISSTVSARMSNELAQAHAEIARLRHRNEFLERKIGTSLGPTPHDWLTNASSTDDQAKYLEACRSSWA